ncbi:hypothetical protein GRI39_06260 [Altererythrobacter indicus]|uniref:LPXTG cell wall anchor domain-containing protein n=1 Tax=Altericroceibacterium indicum TaxID=374177 RepID=A0A845A7I7_9SPHN|nr:hypothetical protein [Altericroceibacterium indicum]MXP25644.1 hypothetical protein [Altericroceibacterium indicum]
MTIRHLLLPSLALLIASPALAAQDSVTGFKLPPSSDQTPEVQGPVVDDVPAPTVPNATPTPKPTSTPKAEPTPKTVATPKPTTSPTPAPATRSPSKPKAEPTPTPRPQTSREAETTPDAALPENAPVATPTPAPAETPTAQTPLPVPAETAPTPEVASSDSGSASFWPWLLGLAIIAIMALGGFLWRKREKANQTPLLLERPRVPAAPQPAATPDDTAPSPPPATADTPADTLANITQDGPLRLAMEARELSLTLINATLSYRLMITNMGEVPLRNLILTGNMIGAHASLTREEQIASEAHDFDVLERIDEISAGGSYVFNEEFRLPFREIRPIRQGNSALFVPLVRFRIIADGLPQTALQTSMIGLRSERAGGGLQPFRLDQGPRVFTDLAQRAFT